MESVYGNANRYAAENVTSVENDSFNVTEFFHFLITYHSDWFGVLLQALFYLLLLFCIYCLQQSDPRLRLDELLVRGYLRFQRAVRVRDNAPPQVQSLYLYPGVLPAIAQQNTPTQLSKARGALNTQLLKMRKAFGSSLPETQTGFRNETLAALVSFLACSVCAYRSKNSDKARYLAECALLATVLSSEPALNEIDVRGFIHDLMDLYVGMTSSTPKTQAGWTDIPRSKYFKKVLALASMVLGALVSYKTRYKFDHAAFLKGHFMDSFTLDNSLSLFDLINEVFGNLTKRAEYFKEQGSWYSFFMDDFENRQLLEKVNAILAHEEAIRASTYDVAGFKSNYDCLAKITEVIEECQMAKKTRHTGSVVMMGLMKLIALKDYVHLRTKGNRVREQPFGVLISGKSGMLKTACTNILVKSVLIALNEPSSDEYICKMDLAHEFDSTYEPTHVAVVLDELANTKPEYSETVITEKILDLINNAPVCTNQAELQRKGQIWYKPRVVVGTTNDKTLSAHIYSKQPDAIMRRFIHIEISKVIPAKDPADIAGNQFEGKIYEYRHRDANGLFIRSLFYSFDNTKQLVKYVVKRALEHADQQKAFVDGCKKFSDELPCPHQKLKAFCEVCSPSSEFDSDLSSSEDEDSGVEESKCVDSCPNHERPNAQSLDMSNYLSDHVGWFNRLLLYIIYVGAALAEFQLFDFMNSIASVRFNLLGRSFTLLQAKAFFATGCYAIGMYTNFPVLFCGLASTPFYYVGRFVILRIRSTAYRVAFARVQSVRWCWRPTKWLKYVAIVTCALSTLRIMYMVSADGDAQNGHEEGEHVYNDPENVWKKNGVTYRSVKTSQKHKSFVFEDKVQQLQGKTGTSCASVKVRFGTTVTMASYIKGGYWVINKHFVDKLHQAFVNGKKCSFLVEKPFERKFSDKSMTYTPGMFMSVADDSDLMLFKFYTSVPKDLYDMLPDNCEAFVSRKSEQYMPMRGRIVAPNTTIEFSSLRHIGTMYFDNSDLGMISSNYVLKGVTDVPTVGGMCGLPYLAKTGNGSMIVGYHTGGSPDSTSFCVALTKQMVDKTIAKFEKQNLGVFTQSDNDDFYIPNPKTGNDVDLTTTHPHWKGMAIAAAPCGSSSVTYHGKLSAAPLAHPKSKVEKSYISDSVAEVFEEPRKHGQPGGHYGMSHPIHYQRHFDNATNIRTQIPIEVLNTACEDYISRIANSDALKDELYRLKPLPLDAAINGVPGRWGVDRLPMSTSAGYPLGGSKDFLFQIDPDTKHATPTPALQTELERAEEHLKEGKMLHPVFNVNLKDEPRKFTKDKVRPFAGSPIVFSILLRKYVLPLASVMSLESCRETFECAVGTNVYSYQWGDLCDYLSRFGTDQIVAGDYAAFDMSMSAEITERAYGIMFDIIRSSNYYSPQDLIVVKALFSSLMHPTYLSQGELFTVHGSNPSGNNLTVMVNCIANSLYVRSVYYMEAARVNCALSFNDTVTLMTYGDDNIMGVSPRVSDWFNHTTLSSGLLVFNIVYTMPDKESESVPLLSIDNEGQEHRVSFLKREFVRATLRIVDDSLPDGCSHFVAVCFCPLEKDSLFKMLHCYKGGDLDIYDDSIIAIETSLREAFQHGPEFYDDFRSKLLCVIEKEDIKDVKTPTYDCALQNWFQTHWAQQTGCNPDTRVEYVQ